MKMRYINMTRISVITENGMSLYVTPVPEVIDIPECRNRLGGMTHDDFVETHTPTSGCRSRTSSSLPSNHKKKKSRCVQAAGAVLAHLTDEKRKHSHVLWVNLQDELVFEGNGQIFTPRESSCLDQHIPIPSSDPQLIEVEHEWCFLMCLAGLTQSD